MAKDKAKESEEKGPELEKEAEKPAEKAPKEPEKAPKEAEKAPSKKELALSHLKDLAAFVHEKSDDNLHQDHGLNKIHVGLIREFADKKAKNKEINLSDGHMETLALVHAKLKKAKKL